MTTSGAASRGLNNRGETGKPPKRNESFSGKKGDTPFSASNVRNKTMVKADMNSLKVSKPRIEVESQENKSSLSA